jgi:hypothetical protein
MDMLPLMFSTEGDRVGEVSEMSKLAEKMPMFIFQVERRGLSESQLQSKRHSFCGKLLIIYVKWTSLIIH